MTTVSILAGLGGGGFKVANSLRFRSSASAYLNRTPATTTNQKTWTWSGWVKRGILGATVQDLFVADGGATTGFELRFDDTNADCIKIIDQLSGTVNINLTTTQVFRDPSAWYHVVLAVDTTQATAANRLKLYVNGSQVTAFSTATYPAQNYATQVDNNTAHYLGAFAAAGTKSRYYDGYLAEVNFIDGQALPASSFGTYDTNGVWQPINFSGTYGTNGFHLTFGNTTSTTTLGYDTSGNGNNWTTNNISLTAGTTYDSMTDSPTVTSASVANYAVMSPIDSNNPVYSGVSTSNGNLTFSSSASPSNNMIAGTIAMSSGKYYFEATINSIGNNAVIGIVSTSANITGTTNCFVGVFSNSYGYYSATGNKINNATFTAYGATYTTGDVIGVAFDAGTGTLTFYKNNTSQGTAFTVIPSGNYLPSVSGYGGVSVSLNFGQQPFTYTPPTGFNALNTYNLPSPVIANGAQYMAATTYTGTGASLTINNGTNTTIGTTFQPDLVWMKSRSAATDHALFDVVRGTTLELISDSTAAETTQATGLTAFGSTGFTIGAEAKLNTSTATYVGWQWKGGGTGVSNTNGSITSTVSANTTAGFSVVTYTGTGANATVGHGLGVAPSMVITKSRSLAGSHWTVYHISLGNTGALLLDTTASTYTSSTYWNSTSPTSSVFSVGVDGGVNNSGSTFVAYCWAAVAGYSAFGSYTGNGSTDGPFVYTGFRPRYVLIKRTDSTSDWYIWDTSRDTYNVEAATLLADTSGAETSATSIDGLSNGFKCRSATVVNASGGTYIYAAFAESPFQSARAR